MHHPTDRITHTTAFVTPVVEHWLEREIAQWVKGKKDDIIINKHFNTTVCTVCGMVHIKDPLLLIGKNSLCSDVSSSLLLSEWSSTIKQ